MCVSRKNLIIVIKSKTKIFYCNSCAVRISKYIMKATGLKVNDKIDVTLNPHGDIVAIKTADTNKSYDHFPKILDESLDENQEY